MNNTRMPLAHPTARGPKTVEVVKTEEKGSDVNLATFLLADAFRKDAECFVVISNDSDLKEPIRLVRHELYFKVGIVNPHPPKKRSRALLDCNPTFFKQIRTSALAASQFPSTMTVAAGTITKPSTLDLEVLSRPRATGYDFTRECSQAPITACSDMPPTDPQALPGEIASMAHAADGTLVSGRDNEDLAGELAEYTVF